MRRPITDVHPFHRGRTKEEPTGCHNWCASYYVVEGTGSARTVVVVIGCIGSLVCAITRISSTPKLNVVLLTTPIALLFHPLFNGNPFLYGESEERNDSAYTSLPMPGSPVALRRPVTTCETFDFVWPTALNMGTLSRR